MNRKIREAILNSRRNLDPVGTRRLEIVIAADGKSATVNGAKAVLRGKKVRYRYMRPAQCRAATKFFIKLTKV